MTQMTGHSTDVAFSLVRKIFWCRSQRRKQTQQSSYYIALDPHTLSDIGFEPGSITWIGRPLIN